MIEMMPEVGKTDAKTCLIARSMVEIRFKEKEDTNVRP
jgi:hypothetical protein